LDLESIAQETKISVRMLELIEGDQFHKLPGGVFAKSFVRQYARAIGLDEEELVRELERNLEPAAEPPSHPQEIRKPQPQIRIPRVAQWSGGVSRFESGSSLPSLGLMVLVMLACSAAYTWWQRPRQTPAKPTPAQIAQRQGAAQPSPTAPETVGSMPTSVLSAPGTPAPQTMPAASSADAGGLTIALTAEEATWVRATANGKIVFSGILQPNESKSLSAAEPMILRIGNAGGLAISLNGKSIPAVGPRGQVRTVQLSPDGGVQVVAPVTEQPPRSATPQQTRSL
jgi:cytoskeletal protein RodZ